MGKKKINSTRYQARFLARFLHQQNVAMNLKLSSSNIYLKEYLPKL